MRTLGVFGRAAPPPDQPQPAPRPHLRVLRADGQRIDLTSRQSGALMAATKQAWQPRAYDYRDMIGELRYAIRLLSRSVAKARFYVAEHRPHPLDPAPLDTPDGEKPEHGLDPQLAADAVVNFAQLPIDTNPDGFIARLVENLSLAGEAWVHIDAQDRVHARSVSEVTATTDGRVTLNGLPGTTHGASRLINPADEDLLRLWIPHPEWGQLADSPMRSLLDVAEDVVLAGREQRSAARSRLAANGILFVPDSMSLVRAHAEDDDRDDTVTSDTFMSDLTAAMVAPISDDGDAGGVVPIVIRGAAEDIAAVEHITLQRADSEQLIARQSAAILRLLKGLDIQPEQVEGLGASNHWSAWLIEAQSVRHQVQPMAETVAACLAQAFLRPALEALGHSAADTARVTIAVDVSPLAENPNRGQDARDAHAAGVISDDAFREALGFDAADAPTEEQLVRQLAIRGNLPVDVIAEVLGLIRGRQRAITVPGETVEPSTRPAVLPGELNPARTTPTEPDLSRGPDGPVVAAAAPRDEWRVDPAASRRLADIDAALTEKVLVAADAALQRVLERAGARVRNAARRDHAVVASLAGVDAHLIAAHLGRDRVETFTPVADLIADGYDRLRTQLATWLAAAADQTADAVCATLGLTPTAARGRAVHAAVVSRLAAHTDRAWPVLAAELAAAAEDALFDPTTPADGDGESDPALISVQAVVDALAAAGGEPSALTAAAYGGGRRRRHRRPIKRTPGATPATGPATGPVVRGILAEQGAITLGWEWQYRPELLRDVFDPHKQLDGARFTSWRDPLLATGPATAWVGPFFHPTDHTGCFIAGTEVSGPPAFASFARPYRGEGVEIRTESGKVLTGTPNHPILTPSGWVPMGELGEGAEVVVARDSERALEIDDEAHQVPALIEDVAAALPMTDGVVARPVPTAPEDFHGDGSGSDGQVTVVRTDRRLLLDGQAAPAQLVRDDVLLLGDSGHGTLPPEGVLDPLVPGDRLAAHGSVGGNSDSLPLLRGGVVVPGEASFAAVARDDAAGNKGAPNDDPGNAVLARQSQFGGSGDVGVDDTPGDLVAEVAPSVGPLLPVRSEDLTDSSGSYAVPTGESLDRFAGGTTTEKVVHLRRIELDCHVYNLSTTTGWYLANGVIVHNCRCTASPVLMTVDDPESVMAQALRDAHGDPARVLFGGAVDTPPGRDTPRQDTAGLRARAAAAVADMQAEHINRKGTRR